MTDFARRGGIARWCSLIILVVAAGCSSSLRGTPDPWGNGDGIVDGGIALLDASDDRGIPLYCDASPKCIDEDPCTHETCWNDVCQFTAQDTVLSQVAVVAAGVGVEALDVALTDGRMYVAQGEAGVTIYNITDPALPQPLGVAATRGPALAVDAEPRGFFVAEGESGLENFAPTGLTPIGGVWTGLDEVVEVSIGPGYAIVSGFVDGVSLFDMTNFQEPARVRNLDSPGRAIHAASNPTTGLVADSLAGAISVLFSVPGEGPQFSGKLMTNGRVTDVAVSNHTALLAEYGAGFSVVDFSDPLIPERLAIVPTAANCIAVGLVGQQTGIVVEEDGNVTKYNLIDPYRPEILSTWTAPAPPLDIDVHNGLIALAMGAQGTVLVRTGCVGTYDSQ